MKHSKHSGSIARRIATFAAALLFMFGGLFAGGLAAAVQDVKSHAASTTGDVANYSISSLPRKNWTVGDAPLGTQPSAAAGSGTVFALYWISSNKDILVGFGAVEDGVNITETVFGTNDPAFQIRGNNADTKLVSFNRAGTYVYRFYKNAAEFNNTRDDDDNTAGTSFYSYPVTVEETNWRVELPENTADIIPNVVFPNMPITLSLPSGIYDRKGNNLLDFDNEESVTALCDELIRIRTALDGKLSANGKPADYVSEADITDLASKVNVEKDKVTLEQAAANRNKLKALLLSQMDIKFYDNGTSVSAGTDENDLTINSAARRTFTTAAKAHGDRFYAEYSINVANVSASYTTENIMVDSTSKTSINWADSTASASQRENIWFVKSPTISKVPVDGDFEINIETTLPNPTVNLMARADIPEADRTAAVEFTDSPQTIDNYTFVTVRFKGTAADGWTGEFKWVGLDANGEIAYYEGDAGEANATKITDFKFTPHARGEYEFYYYTRTIFGTGHDQDGVVKKEWDSVEYIRHTPFDPIKITRDATRPTIKWTSDYDYVAGATGTDNGNVVTQDAGYLYKVTTSAEAADGATRIEADPVRQPERAYYGTDWASTATNLFYVLDANGQRQFAELDSSNKITTVGTKTVTVAEALRAENGRVYASANGDYSAAGTAVNMGEQVRYSETPDLTSHLPSTSSTGKTSLAVGSALSVPALVGDDNVTKSGDMNYLLSVYRHENGSRTGSPVTFESGKKLDSSNTLVAAGDGKWDHTKTFKIYFDDANFKEGILKGFGDQKFDINGRYEIWVRSYDNEVGGRNLGTQFNFFFEVKLTTGTNPWTASKPEAQGLFRIGQNEYYNGDTVSFSTANFTDAQTDAAKIEITYHVSFKNASDEYGHDIGTYEIPAENIVGGRVSFDISEENEIGAKIISEMASEHVTEFRIYAVARNYHALVNNLFYKEGSTNEYVAAVYDAVTVYDLSYGEAAKITSSEWDNYFNGSSAGGTQEEQDALASKLVQQNNRVYLPAFEFEYTNESSYSSITFEIVQPQGGSVLGASVMDGDRRKGGGWQGVFTDSDGKKLVLGDSVTASNDPSNVAHTFAGRRFFIPTQVGLHTVIVTCTNAGGNVAVYVGQINVEGKPQYQATLRGTADTADMRIGMVRNLPSVEITINNEVFTSSKILNEGGKIVTTKEMTAIDDSTVKYPAGTQIGTFEIVSGSLNGNAPKWVNNKFAPLYADDYEFEYVITITDNAFEAETAGGSTYKAGQILGGVEFDTRIVHTSKVAKLNDTGDILIDLQAQDYREFGAEVLPDDTTRKVNTFDQLLVDGADGKVLSMSDTQLFDAMIADEDNKVADVKTWKYGRIYVPNFNLDLNEEVKEGLLADFTGKDIYGNSKVESYVTVHFSGQPDDEYLLDTRDDDYEAVGFNGTSSYYWFRPYGGKTVPTAETEPAGADWAAGWEDANGNKHEYFTAADGKHYKLHPSEWENSEAVDGEYTIVYTAVYQNTTTTLEYKITMGDMESPRINFQPDKEEELFSGEKKIGDIFTFSTRDLQIQGGKTDYTASAEGKQYIADNLSVQIYDSNGHTVSLSTGESQPITDGYYTKQVGADEGYDIYTFQLKSAGEYRITFSITSESGMSAVRTKTITVLAAEPEETVDFNEILGTILIILSIGLLIGVVIYFIRTGNATKFQGTHVKKEKEEKPDAVV